MCVLSSSSSFSRFFFFSSRRRHTIFDCDWSSDVCSSDLCLLWRRRLRIGAWYFGLPNVEIALAQVALGSINYFCIAACLHQLMSAAEPISYPAVASAYMAANFAVLLTHVPGGWGVME